MFIAMNRFKVKSGNEVEFEEVWKTRDSFLVKCLVSGFSSFERSKFRRTHLIFLSFYLG